MVAESLTIVSLNGRSLTADRIDYYAFSRNGTGGA
jgi:hypothetical protein